MTRWAAFWEGLNIRKAITLVLVLAFIVLVSYLRDANLIAMLGTIVTTVVGYWFGYENGKKAPHEFERYD